MRRAIVVVLACLLAACSPALRQTAVGAALSGVQLVQGDPATLTRDGSSILLTNPGPEALTGDLGRVGDGVALTVEGPGLRLDSAARLWCGNTITTPDRWACNVPNLAPGTRARITPAAGSITAALALGYRVSSGTRPVLVQLR